MKKIKILSLLILNVLLLSGCEKNSIENGRIYTTIYPVKYITEFLYGENSTVESIYPAGVNINEYKLTDKQIETYSKGNLFVYIGLSNEKEIAKSLINKNHNLLIIDATYGLNSNNIKELWLAPNNFLMLAKNIKNSLNEYLDNPIKSEEVDRLYNELYKKVSWIDAELRSLAKDASSASNNTIIASSNIFKYLEGYGFNVISLEEIELSNSENALLDIKNKFKSGTYSHILKLSNEINTELMKELAEKYKAKVYSVNDLVTNSDTASDYTSIQYENISVIRDILLK